MKIKLKPCYPEGTDIDDQLEKLEDEYQEYITASSRESWQRICKELLDIAQVTTGLIHIEDDKVKEYKLQDIIQQERDYNIEAVEYKIKYHSQRLINNRGFYRNCLGLINFCLVLIYKLVKKNDRNCEKIRNEIIEQLLDEHYQKLERRKEEWGNV